MFDGELQRGMIVAHLLPDFEEIRFEDHPDGKKSVQAKCRWCGIMRTTTVWPTDNPFPPLYKGLRAHIKDEHPDRHTSRESAGWTRAGVPDS